MKKIFFVLAALLFVLPLSAEITKKTINIDALYKIELKFDSAKSILELNLLSDNSAVFDESYAEDNIQEALEDFFSENGFSEGSIIDSKIDKNASGGKYTSLIKTYKVE